MPTRMSFLTPSCTSSSITIAADGQPMPLDWTETGAPSEGAGEAEHPALGVALHDVLEEGLGDVLGAQRVAGEEAGLGVVARARSNVDRHGRQAYGSRRASVPTMESRVSALVEPTTEQILRFCAEDPVERVFLEDVARRGHGRFAGLEREDGDARGALPPRLERRARPGAAAPPSPSLAARSRARMLIGEERAVGELWEAARTALAGRRGRTGPGQPVYVIDDAARAGGTGLRRATLDDLDLLVPACAAAHEEELGVDPLRARPERLPLADARADRGGPLVAVVEDGVILFKAEASAWTPEAVQLQQVWVDPSRAARATAAAALRDLIRLLLESVPRVCLFVRRRERAGDPRSTRRSACGGSSTTAAALLRRADPRRGMQHVLVRHAERSGVSSSRRARRRARATSASRRRSRLREASRGEADRPRRRDRARPDAADARARARRPDVPRLVVPGSTRSVRPSRAGRSRRTELGLDERARARARAAARAGSIVAGRLAGLSTQLLARPERTILAVAHALPVAVRARRVRRPLPRGADRARRLTRRPTALAADAAERRPRPFASGRRRRGSATSLLAPRRARWLAPRAAIEAGRRHSVAPPPPRAADAAGTCPGSTGRTHMKREGAR